MQDIAVQ